ncbi:MAG: cytochrome c, partial [Acidobacteriota bacterium]
IMVSSLWHLVISLGLFILFLIFLYLWKSKKFGFKSSIAMFLTIFVFFGAFEFIREAGRKPYIIKDYMYSTGIRVADFDKIKDQSVLKNSKWTESKDITPDNAVKAGGEIFRIQCYACHSLGIKNNINRKMADWDLNKIRRIIGSLKGITPFMPGFAGNDVEKDALAKWFYWEVHGNLPQEKADSTEKLDGPAIFESFCSDCHENSPDDPLFIKTMNVKEIEEMINILGRLNVLNEDMPPFEGSDREKQTLAEYIIKSRSKK